jgi:hypothetical protein
MLSFEKMKVCVVLCTFQSVAGFKGGLLLVSVVAALEQSPEVAAVGQQGGLRWESEKAKKRENEKARQNRQGKPSQPEKG